jgi:hypothetical protein
MRQHIFTLAPNELSLLRALARYETHGGYTWAGVMSDGELMCVPCLRANYRQVFRATRTYSAERGLSFVTPQSGWELAGIANSGEAESGESAQCCNCNKIIWDGY